MKIRKGFVSNSSSSSFIISDEVLTFDQIEALESHCSSPIGQYRDTWDVYRTSTSIQGYTSMRNNVPGEGEGDLMDWMDSMRFPMNKIKWTNY